MHHVYVVSMTYFEEAFTQLVRATMGEIIREQVAAHLEMLRGPAWVTKDEAARLLGCSKRTLARHVAMGRVAVSKPPQSPMLVERASINELLQAARMPRREWRHPWLGQPRDLNPHKSPKQVAAGKLGYHRRVLKEIGFDETTVEQILTEPGKQPRPRAPEKDE